MSFTELMLRNRHAVWALAIAAAIFGIYAYVSIPMQLFPDTAPPLVNVITAYPGASADDVAEELSRKLEEEFAALEGIVKVKSSSQDNMALISVEFQYDTNIDIAAVDVQNAIARIRSDLPAGIKEPQVLKFSTSDRPIISIGVASENLVAVRRTAEDELAPRLQRVDGVAAVDVFGGSVPALLVEVNRRDLEARGIPLAKVVDTMNKYNAAMPAGQLRSETTQTMFRVESRSMSVEELEQIPLTLPDGSRVLLADLANIGIGSLDDDSRFAINSKDSIALQVFKTDDANTVEVVRLVRGEVENLKKDYSAIKFFPGEESATFTELSVDNLLSNVWQALLLASIIIFLFLGTFKNSMVTVVSMPLSYGITFALMRLFEIEFNLVTLSAVILAVGMVVDATVVILENVTRRREQEGLSPEKAAIEGTREVQIPVLAGVLTTIIVLIPLMFLEGFIGKTFGPLAITLLFAFVGSILVALVLVPTLTLYTTKPSRFDKWGSYLSKPFMRVMDTIQHFYEKALRVALKKRAATLLLVFILFVVAMVGIIFRGMEVLPKMDGGSFFVSLETPSGSSLEETQRVVRDVGKILEQEDAVTIVQSQVGFEQGMRTISSFGVQGPTQGYITVTLTPRTQRKETIWDIEDRVRQKIAKVPGIRTVTVRELGNTAKSTTSAPILVRISGPDPLVLNKIGDQVMEKISIVESVIEPMRNWRFDQKRMRFDIDPLRVGEFGLSPKEAAGLLQSGSYGMQAGDYYGTEGSPIPVWVSYGSDKNTQPEDMLGYPIFMPGSPQPIPLSAIAQLKQTVGQGLITHEDLIPTLEVSAFAQGRALNFVIQDVEQKLSGITVPKDYSLDLTGEKSDLAEAKTALFGAVGVALIAVYLLLVAQLRSFIHPITIMVTVPLSMIGVSAALWISGKTASMPVMVGIILLVGIVVNNAIILLEFVRQKREEGMDTKEALVDSVRMRFRPIMMTSLSTIVGMVPLAAEWALGAERFSPLAIAVIGGMTAATFLTMVVIPVIYDLFNDLTESIRRRA